MGFKTGLGARISVKGTLTYRNAKGEVIGNAPFTATVPLSELGLSTEQEKQLIEANQTEERQPLPKS